MKSAPIAQELVSLLKQHAIDAGRELATDIDELQLYTARTLDRLALCASEPGYQEALIAARDAVALKAAGLAVDQADATDARMIGIVHAGLSVGARALTAALIV